MQTIKQPIITIIICLAVLAGVNIIYAWTDPPYPNPPGVCTNPPCPPGGNVPPPINAGPDTQSKTGALSIQGVFQTNNQTYLALSGNVGIGTTAPDFPLSVVKTGTTITGTLVGSLEAMQDATNKRGVILGYDTSGQIGTITADSASAASQLAFWTYNGGWGERVRIDNAGNVGIGTTGPSAKLQIGTPANAIGAMSTTLASHAGNLGSTAGNTINVASFGFGPGNTTALGIRGYRTANGSSYLTTAIGLGMDVDDTSYSVGNAIWFHNNGNVGIGTTNPGKKLHVSGGDILLDTAQHIMWKNAGGTPTNIMKFDGVDTTITTGGSAFHISNAAETVALFRVQENGNVGIGTTNPGAKLDIAGNIKIADGTQGAGRVLTSDANGLASWQIPSGGGTPIPTGSYGWCKRVWDGGVYSCSSKLPASCSAAKICQCPADYNLIQTGEYTRQKTYYGDEADYSVQYYSCYKL